MRTTTFTTLTVNASYASATTYDNSITVHDVSGDKFELKGLTNEQLDSICSNWLRDRIRRDDNVAKAKGYEFTRLQAALNEMWPAESAV